MTQNLFYYYPTTIHFLDDDELFLKALLFDLTDKHLLIYSTNADLTLSRLNEVKAAKLNCMSLVDEQEHELLDEILIKPSINNLHKIIYDGQRFAEITTLVVDCYMPTINGADVCQRITNAGVKKVMLTGSADFKLATELFNQGLIDHFILKDHKNLKQDLSKSVAALQYKLFIQRSQSITNLIPKEKSCLFDKEYGDWVNQLVEQCKIVEFYLLDEYGSQLFLDEIGNRYWLIIKPWDEMTRYANIAQDNIADSSLINVLLSKKHLLCLLTDANHKAPIDSWVELIREASDVPFDNRFGFCFFKNQDNHFVDQEKVISLSKYKKNMKIEEN